MAPPPDWGIVAPIPVPSFFSLSRLGPLQGALIGALVGGLYGGWTLASRPPEHAVFTSGAAPFAPPACPDGYARTPGYDPSALLGDTRVRWLARCDPRTSGGALSESLEILFADQVLLDPRARDSALNEFARTLSRSGDLVLDAPHPPRDTTVAGVPAQSLDVDGAYRLPPLSVRAWLLPAGGRTLQVTLVSPRARADAAAQAARRAIDRIEGLRAYDPAAPHDRGFDVHVACPEGFTDATPTDGGPAPGVFVGRSCLSPSDDGGAELTFAELTGRASDPAAVRTMLNVIAMSDGAVGVSTGSGFGPVETVHVGGVEGSTAVMNVDPPAARARLRVFMVPAGDATLYGVSVSTPEHADSASTTLVQWMERTGHVRAYDPNVLAAHRRDQAWRMVFAPALLSAGLGAIAAAIYRRSQKGAG
jgi:hypothetical protein